MLSRAQQEAYAAEGFLAPLRAISPADALAGRAGVERLIAQGTSPADLRTKAHLRCPALLGIVRSPAVLDAVSDLIGPDVLCRSSSIFLKEPNNPA
jgi:hypothetical protein